MFAVMTNGSGDDVNGRTAFRQIDVVWTAKRSHFRRWACEKSGGRQASPRDLRSTACLTALVEELIRRLVDDVIGPRGKEPVAAEPAGQRVRGAVVEYGAAAEHDAAVQAAARAQVIDPLLISRVGATPLGEQGQKR